MLNHAKRSSRRSRTLSMYLAAGAAAVATATAPVMAGPEGETVVYGDVTFVRSGDVWTVYVGDLAIIQYSSFDIAPHEMVQFIQPGANSRVLNRILSGSPTNIEGTLLANGQIYLVNPSGVIFGKDSVVNAGAIYAAAGNISNQDFLAGVNRFTNTGAVQNFGTLEGDLVSLVGSTVANHGQIRAREGTVIMAAGEQVVIGEQFGSLYVKVDGPSGQIDTTPLGGPSLAAGDVFSLAAWNTGTIEARNAHIESTGTTLVSGTVDVSGQTGGSVAILGEAVELRGAMIDASGVHGGGSVLIGGPREGQGDVRSASITIVDVDSTVSADATRSGDGGSVVVWSDDATVVDGALSARGGADSGDGGFIETSSRGFLSVTRAADAGAANGAGGLWLLDPTNIFIVNDPLAPGSADLTSGDSNISVQVINAALSSGTSVTISSNSMAGGQGNIYQFADAAIIKSGGGLATLSLLATGNIDLFGGVFDTSGNGLNLTLMGGMLPAAGPQVPGQISIACDLDLGSGWLRAAAGSVKIQSQDAFLNPVTVDAGHVWLMGLNGGSVEIAGDVTTYGQIGGSTDGVRLEGSFVGISGDITTKNGGSMLVNASSVLTLAPSTTLNLDGRFLHTGGGLAQIGSDIFTTGDSVTFEGDAILLDDVLISTVDLVNNQFGLINFNKKIDSAPFGILGSPFDLTLDAGMADIIIGGDIGSSFWLQSVDFLGRNITLQSVETLYSQSYRADTVFLQGGLLASYGSAQSPGNPAQIEVLSDGFYGFAGDTVLQQDVKVQTAGAFGDDVLFTGTVESEANMLHRLTVDAGDAYAVFGATVGEGAASSHRLGFLEVFDAQETKLFGDVYTRNGMSFWTPVEVNGSDTIIHTGDGVAFFASDIYAGFGDYFYGDGYSERGDLGSPNVSFLYDGTAWVDLGSARAPFKFGGNIGTNGELVRGLEFGTVRFGSDLASVPASASFLFGTGNMPGTELSVLGLTDFAELFNVFATDAIIAGQGQKITSFGSLTLFVESGVGEGLIQFGDVNVVGDFTARVAGGEIVLRLRDAFGVEFAGTEDDRFNSLPVDLLDDIGAELIVMGDITLEADSITTDASGTSSTSFLFATDAGAGVINGSSVLTFEGGVGADDFISQFEKDGLLYSYDLALVPDMEPEPEPTPPNLGLAFRDSDRLDPRYVDRYLPDPLVLAELNLSPRDIPADVLLASLDEGVTYQINDYAEGADSPTDAGTAVATITRDRLSRPAITRLTDAYVALLGERVSEDSTDRVRTAAVHQAIADAWARSGGGDAESFRAWLDANDADAAGVMRQMDALFAAFEGIELPAHEKGIARDRLIEKVRPASMPREVFEGLFPAGGPDAVAMR